jgi:signal transduction histidine kinase
VAAWAIVAATVLSRPLPTDRERTVILALSLDLVLGLASLGLLPFRRRYPLGVACAASAVLTFSVASLGVVTLAVASMAAWRRRSWIVATGLVTLIGAIVSKLWYHPTALLTEPGLTAAGGGILLGLMSYAATVATGSYLAARRDLIASLRAQVRTAERERALTGTVAREAERRRIAREMHDALAHRISLVALHAGALAYRQDLTRPQLVEAAETIQTNAQLALAELRQVLGVLRDGAEPPQPTLAELPALLADAREAGSVVELDSTGLAPAAHPPEALSRTSFRIVQETLTNARRHAPGEPVRVRLAGAPGGHLLIEVRNRVGTRPAPDERPGGPGLAGFGLAGPELTGLGLAGPGLAGLGLTGLGLAGLGLAGLGERAELAGGVLEHRADDGYFTVSARLPWPA